MGANSRSIYVDACCRDARGFGILSSQGTETIVEKYHVAHSLRTHVAEQIAVWPSLRGTENERNDITVNSDRNEVVCRKVQG